MSRREPQGTAPPGTRGTGIAPPGTRTQGSRPVSRRPFEGPAEEAAREGVGRYGVGESGDGAAVFRGVVLLLSMEAATDLVAVEDEVRGAGDQDSGDDQGGCLFGLHRSFLQGGGFLES